MCWRAMQSLLQLRNADAFSCWLFLTEESLCMYYLM
jgi:hypothetical protein